MHYLRRLLHCLLGVAGFIAAAAHAANGASLDAQDLDEAALMVAMEMSSWDGWRRECAVILPTEARGIASYYVRWQDDNRAAILAMRSYAEHEKNDADGFAPFERMQQPDILGSASSATGKHPRQLCVMTFESLKAGKFAFARRYPGAARMLAVYLAAQPLSRAGTRAYDNPLGCVKAALNQGSDYEPALTLCRCNWQAMDGDLSAAEWDEYERAADNSAEGAKSLPQFRRVMPKLAACTAPIVAK